MRPKLVLVAVIVAVVVLIALLLVVVSPPEHYEPGANAAREPSEMPKMEPGGRLKLPEPRYASNTSVEAALAQRRSLRAYSGDALTIEELAQLLWAAQGVTTTWGGRTAPSAGALYPLELYVVVGTVTGLDAGVYRYRPATHELEKRREGDLRAELAEAALSQGCIGSAAIDLVFCGVFNRTTVKYRERGIRYVYMEVGHAAQNVYLQAESMDLGTVTIGAFDDAEVQQLVGMQEQERPLCIMPVGRKG
ncbi:MAG TPA: SagB/ThcOx family dehydrogenase [Methanomicrobia archaeon]|nr:SagB/ThcOx family dehydrogenase [Methanomicrobia archaeon]